MIEYIIVGMWVAIIFCPPRYDPAIKFKEANYNIKRFWRYTANERFKT